MRGVRIVATGVLLAAFVGLEVVLLGRVFRASLLGAGVRPSLAMLFAMMRRSS